MKETTELSYTEKFIKVSDLEIDRRVQRSGLNKAKVAWMVENWNPAAKGLVHVSYRTPSRANILLDGMHRTEAERIISENTGEMWCRVFTGLTLAQESQMFLDLNRTTAPTLIDKYKVLLNGDSDDAAAAQDIERIVNQYGWSVARTPGPGNINCIGVLTKVYNLSVRKNRDPNLIQLAILAITTAWGTHDRTAVEGSLVDAVAAIYDEYGSNLDHDRFVNILAETEGGPTGLLARAQVLAKARGGKRANGIADILMEHYNKGLKGRSLGAWRKR